MSAIKLSFSKKFMCIVNFEGEVEGRGASGYTFSGTLDVWALQYRGVRDFKDTARLGHGGSSKALTYDDFSLNGPYELDIEYTDNREPYIYDKDDNKKILSKDELDYIKEDASGRKIFKVEGNGTRADNEPVEFCVGFNDGPDGEFHYGDKIKLTPMGPKKKINPSYQQSDSFGKLKYDVRLLEGSTIHAATPTTFNIECELDAYGSAGTVFTPYATFGYKTSSGSWQYKTFAIDDTPQKLNITGVRKAGENVQLVVGATSQVANLYAYGDEVDCALPGDF